MRFSPCEVRCSICACKFDYHKRYGREAVCCSRDCYSEFEWRWSLSILGKPYQPRQPDHAEEPTR